MTPRFTKGRFFLIAAQLLAVVLFIYSFGRSENQTLAGWGIPLSMVLLIIVNSVWFTRFVSWLIFALSFFALLIVLSAFTLRWRLEPGFSPAPFYRAIAMYATFIYVCLAQIKILGGGGAAQVAPTEGGVDHEATS